METIFLNLSDVLDLHKRMLSEFGGSDGVRSFDLLLSALEMPQSGFAETYFHESIFSKASAYLFHIVKNHPFVDGNKRVGLFSALVFLETNGVRVEATDREMYDLTISVAEGKTDKPAIAAFFEKHIIPA